MHEPDDPQIEPSKVVIQRRGMDDIEWSTEDGLINITMAPFGVLGVFGGKRVRQQLISWYEVASFTVYDLSFRSGPEEAVQITTCGSCGGTGLVSEGRRCPACGGFGHNGRAQS